MRAALMPCEYPDLRSQTGAGDGNRTRTISLGTGLSGFGNHRLCRSANFLGCPPAPVEYRF